jgi:SpoVK/Ycf46/Vps4 family AAA+-type ATPase|tara:strand:+ start:7696 stop:9168 length:1473 start_codon:yes stop_codon:yes gene_type:complete
MNFTQELLLLIKAKYPIIYITTHEEERVEYIIKHCTQELGGRAVYTWDFIDGYTGTPFDQSTAKGNPIQALNLIEKLTPNTPSLFIMKDFDIFFKDVAIIRKTKNVTKLLKIQPKNMIIISSKTNIPESLQDIITILEFPLPNKFEINAELSRLLKALNHNISEDLLERLVKACQGLTLERIRRVFSKIIVESNSITEQSIHFILLEKQQIIKQTQILEFYPTNKTLLDIGGLEKLKSWLSLRSESLTKKAEIYGIPFPRGVLLTGIQGTGKSLTAKAIANEWNLPLLRLDIGRVFTGIVGESEARVRQTIQIAEALAPCILWVDEIDKSFSNKVGNTDNGTTNRVFSTFLTWLSEKQKPVFFVATANNIEVLPAELVRKGRFDEIFFLDLPKREEREKIFRLHLLKKRQHETSRYNIRHLSEITEKFSGAEIEQVVIEAMRIGFQEKREFTGDDLMTAAKTIIPLAFLDQEQIEVLQEWVQSGKARLAG